MSAALRRHSVVRVEMSPLAARVVSLFWLEESLATVDDEEVAVLGCCVDVEPVLEEVSLLVVSFVESFAAVRPALTEVSAELREDELEEAFVSAADEGEVVVLEALRFVSLASEESEVDVERDVSAAVFEVSEEVEEELSEPLAPTEPLAPRELLLDVEAVGAPETLLCAALLVLLLSALVDEDDEDDGELEL